MSAVISVTLLAAPALAHAASVQVRNEGGGPADDYAISEIHFQAVTGERNRVRVVFAGRRATIVDPAGSPRPGLPTSRVRRALKRALHVTEVLRGDGPTPAR